MTVHAHSPEPPTVEPTVVIASAHPLLALGVRGRLEGHGFRVMAEALSAQELVAAVRRHKPDICLIDAALPGGALAAARQARARSRLAVVFLMSTDDSDDGELAIEAVRSGAAGVLFEDMDPERLVYVLRDVVAGGSAVPRMLVARLLGELQLSA